MRKFATLLATIFLATALFDGLPYGFFTMLRFIVFAVATYSGVLAFKTKRKEWGTAFGFLAILFNPFIPIYLDRNIWIIIDAATALFLFSSIFAFRVIKKDNIQSESILGNNLTPQQINNSWGFIDKKFKLTNITKELDKLLNSIKSQSNFLDKKHPINFNHPEKQPMIARDKKEQPYNAKEKEKKVKK